MPSHGLPKNIGDAKSVTSESGSTTARSVGMTASTLSMPGEISGGMRYGAASFQGARMTKDHHGFSPKVPHDPPREAQPSHLKKNLSTTKGGWDINDETLPTVPNFPGLHPIERSAVFVPHSHASTVAKRVSDCLRDESVSATYCDIKAKAKCFTNDNVEFRVRLYRSNNKKFSHGVIVEVQRRFGFSVRFHGVVNAILDAAEGKKKRAFIEEMSELSPTSPEDSIPIVSDDEDDDEDDEDDDFGTNVPLPMTALTSSPITTKTSGIKRKSCPAVVMASNMLKKSRIIDTNVIAMESLASLTDQSHMGNRAALRVSLDLLSPSLSKGKNDVLGAVVSLLSNGCLNDIGSSSIGNYDGNVSSLRLLAMTILCNTICTISSSSCSNHNQVLVNHHDLLLHEILPILINEIKNAKIDPRMAFFAAKCLTELIEVFKKEGTMIVDIVLELDALKVVESAQIEGLTSHAELAVVCGKLLSFLE